VCDPERGREEIAASITEKTAISNQLLVEQIATVDALSQKTKEKRSFVGNQCNSARIKTA
jgi:hypothetical protein